MSYSVTIIGAGLAGSEAAWQLAQKGVYVTLNEMRPSVSSKAHKSSKCAELVCSNSFRGASLTNAVGLLKEELKICGSLIMEAALFSQVPAGGALAVDREVFSTYIDEKIRNHPRINFLQSCITEIPECHAQRPVIIATGPLTDATLAHALERKVGEGRLAFFDAISPILLSESVDWGVVFKASRYGKGNGDDYGNIPLSKEQYEKFIEDVMQAEKYGAHDEVEADSINSLRPFEGCMPIEEMISRGKETLRFGPCKPTGLTDPKTGRWPYAVIQLRQDDKNATLFNMVGFQTRMKHGEQTRIFRSLPGLENAEFVRLGTVHRNTFINSPQILNSSSECKKQDGLFFAGQITGVEGYVESTASGYFTAQNVLAKLGLRDPFLPSGNTALGALIKYITDESRKDFQPMNVSFGLIDAYGEFVEKDRDKNRRRMKIAERALSEIRAITNGS